MQRRYDQAPYKLRQQLQLPRLYMPRRDIIKQYKNVERALLRHTKNALEFKYIEPLLNDDTGLIEDDLPTVLQ